MTYITKEEFGLDLYACIETVGKMMRQKNLIRLHKQQGQLYHVRAAEQELQNLKATFDKQYSLLSEENAAQVLRRYPWVMT